MHYVEGLQRMLQPNNYFWSYIKGNLSLTVGHGEVFKTKLSLIHLSSD